MSNETDVSVETLKLKTNLTVESLKLLQDWSKWLIAIVTFICVNLWPRLTCPPTGTPPCNQKAPTALYLGWMMFWASIVSAAVLLLLISGVVRRADAGDDAADLRKVKLLATLEYSFFFAGLLCFAWRMLQVWLSA